MLAAPAGVHLWRSPALFLGAARGSAGATLLFWFFGGAIVLTVVALAAFVLEMLLAARGVRHLLDHNGSRQTSRRSAKLREGEPGDAAADGADEAGVHEDEGAMTAVGSAGE